MVTARLVVALVVVAALALWTVVSPPSTVDGRGVLALAIAVVVAGAVTAAWSPR